jgi:hypothetical protein
LRQIYTGRLKLSKLRHDESYDDERVIEKYKRYLPKLNIHEVLLNYVKYQAEKHADENLRDLYMTIDQYLQVIANVEVTIKNLFPKGKGTIK